MPLKEKSAKSAPAKPASATRPASAAKKAPSKAVKFPDCTKNGPALVLYYANWCPHCTSFMGKDGNKAASEWSKAKKAIKANSATKGVTILEIEDQKMNMLPANYRVGAFPSLVFYSSPTKAMEYPTYMERSGASIAEFVKKGVQRSPMKGGGLPEDSGCDACGA